MTTSQSPIDLLVPTEKYGKCQIMVQGECDYTVDAFPIGNECEKYGTMLTIATDQGAVYVTREQAKAFFGLVEPSEV